MTLDQLEQKKRLLEIEIADITSTLKELSSLDRMYLILWDRRVSLKEDLRSIEKFIKLNQQS